MFLYLNAHIVYIRHVKLSYSLVLYRYVLTVRYRIRFGLGLVARN